LKILTQYVYLTIWVLNNNRN